MRHAAVLRAGARQTRATRGGGHARRSLIHDPVGDCRGGGGRRATDGAPERAATGGVLPRSAARVRRSADARADRDQTQAGMRKAGLALGGMRGWVRARGWRVRVARARPRHVLVQPRSRPPSCRARRVDAAANHRGAFSVSHFAHTRPIAGDHGNRHRARPAAVEVEQPARRLFAE
jgi:hypothetical protein